MSSNFITSHEKQYTVQVENDENEIVVSTHDEPSKPGSISPDSFLSAFFPCLSNQDKLISNGIHKNPQILKKFDNELTARA